VIIFRYLSKEVLHTLVAITAILLLVFLSNLFVRYLGYAAKGNIPVGLVLKLVAIQIPYLLGLLLPLGFFIAVLLAYGRLYVDSEMTVLLACGMSRLRLINMTVALAAILSSLIAGMTFWMIPHLLTYRNNLMAQAREDAATQVLFPGTFQQLNDGAQVVYVESLDDKRNHARNLFLVSGSDETTHEITQRNSDMKPGLTSGPTLISAARAYRLTEPEKHAQYAVLEDGYRYVGLPGRLDYSITQFATLGFRLNQRVIEPSDREENLPTSQLWKDYGKSPKYGAEIQWRIAMPVAAIVLAFLGVALSKINPRKGKYAQLLPATAVAIIYANLLFVARNAIRSENISAEWGMWYVHLVFLTLAIVLLKRERIYRYYRRLVMRLFPLSQQDAS
jgi:lipopolysaccharide export system permease protein